MSQLTATQRTPVYPGIAELKAEAPMPGHGPLWQINGRIQGGAPDDPEAWGWLAEVSSGWDDTDGGELARFLARAATAYAPLVEALATLECLDCAGIIGEPELVPLEPCSMCADARAALLLARGEVA